MATATKSIALAEEAIINKIYMIRGKKVMLDYDLAEMYGVDTKQLKRQVRRNIERFPADFMYELTLQEYDSLRSQIGTLKRGEHSKYEPMAFTEQGVAMLSSVLNSKTAIEVNIQIIRIFTRMRELLLTNKDILIKLEQMEKKMMKQNSRIKKSEEDIQRESLRSQFATSNFPHRIQRIHNNIHSKLGIILRQEPLVPEVIIPFAAIILIAVEDPDAAVDGDRFEIIMDEIVAPAIQLERSVGRTFLKREKGMIERVMIRDLLQGGRAEEGAHLRFERTGEEPVDIMVAIIRKYKTSVQNVFMKISRLLFIELYQLMPAYITEWVLEERCTVQIDHLLLQVYRQRGIFDQRIQQVGRHPLVRIPVSGPVSQPRKCKLIPRDMVHNVF